MLSVALSASRCSLSIRQGSPESVDTLGQYGKQIKQLSKAASPAPVRDYLEQRQVARKRFQAFGERLLKVSERYRNPGAHDISTLAADDVDDARRQMVGTVQQSGLLAEAVGIHRGARLLADVA